MYILPQSKEKDYMFCSPINIQCAEDNAICRVKCKQLRQTLKIQNIRLKPSQTAPRIVSERMYVIHRKAPCYLVSCLTNYILCYGEEGCKGTDVHV